MKTSHILRRTALALLPAALLLSACGKKDTPAPTPVPDTGRINNYHMAASANVDLKFLFDEAEKANLSYGGNSGYQSVNAGSRVLKVNVATSGTTATTQTVTVAKDKSYSYFAYANSGSSVAGLFVTDDLTAPGTAAGVQQAKIRLVHLAQGAAEPLKISSSSIGGLVDVPGIIVRFAGSALAPTDPATVTVGFSNFVDVPPGTYNLAITSGSPSISVASVGDGSGSGTGTKMYEAGKIYTIVYRGINNALLVPALQPKAVLIQNN